jgi:hypothetical protein
MASIPDFELGELAVVREIVMAERGCAFLSSKTDRYVLNVTIHRENGPGCRAKTLTLTTQKPSR